MKNLKKNFPTLAYFISSPRKLIKSKKKETGISITAVIQSLGHNQRLVTDSWSEGQPLVLGPLPDTTVRLYKNRVKLKGTWLISVGELLDK